MKNQLRQTAHLAVFISREKWSFGRVFFVKDSFDEETNRVYDTKKCVREVAQCQARAWKGERLSKQNIRSRDYDFHCFLECLIDAGSKMNVPHYFQLPVAGCEKPKFRERVYCYELYHQLRNVLGDSFPYKLCGEVNKGGHPLFQEEGLRGKKPDFIVHVPGKMNRNLVVIEVKPVDVEPRELEEDFDKLKRFIEDAKYHRAIMLIYGDGKQELPSAIVAEPESLVGDHEGRILLVWHRGPGKEPVEVW